MNTWLVEGREESNIHTGARRGPWYVCGTIVHRTRVSACIEIERLRNGGCPGPFRAARYVRAKARR